MQQVGHHWKSNFAWNNDRFVYRYEYIYLSNSSRQAVVYAHYITAKGRGSAQLYTVFLRRGGILTCCEK